jgi:cell division protein FtsN
MKIVCMDCQTESHIEVELLKDKKRFECEHCSKNPPVNSTKQMEKQIQLAASDTLDFYAVSASESTSEKGITLFGENEVLEIPSLSSLPQPLEGDEIISVPFYELEATSSEDDSNTVFDDSNAVFIDDNPANEESLAPESPRQLPQTFVPALEVPRQIPETLNPHQPAEETLELLSVPKAAVKVMTVKTSILMGVAIVFVSFIVLGDKIIRPAGKASPETENSRPVITPKREIKPPPPVASSTQPETTNPIQPEPAKPIPTPAAPVVENKPADVTPPANKPPAATAEGQFTVQVGSHNDVAQANGQAEKLKAAGFEPRVVSVDIPKRGKWYRVQSGNFSNRAEANSYAEQILAKGAAENFVIAGP